MQQTQRQLGLPIISDLPRKVKNGTTVFKVIPQGHRYLLENVKYPSLGAHNYSKSFLESALASGLLTSVSDIGEGKNGWKVADIVREG